jgi:hypothetical protein
MPQPGEQRSCPAARLSGCSIARTAPACIDDRWAMPAGSIRSKKSRTCVATRFLRNIHVGARSWSRTTQACELREVNRAFDFRSINRCNFAYRIRSPMGAGLHSSMTSVRLVPASSASKLGASSERTRTSVHSS